MVACSQAGGKSVRPEHQEAMCLMEEECSIDVECEESESNRLLIPVRATPSMTAMIKYVNYNSARGAVHALEEDTNAWVIK